MPWSGRPARIEVARHDGEVGGDPAVRQRDAGQRPAPASAELSPGTTVDRDAGGDAGQPLLSAAAEDERVAALEPDDPLAGARALDEHVVDLVLASGCAGAPTCRSR